jgi:hypothetical protein
VNQVTDERVRLVLGQYTDAPYARIDAVRQREIDNPVLAAKIKAWLGAPVCQLVEAGSAATRQDQGQ